MCQQEVQANDSVQFYIDLVQKKQGGYHPPLAGIFPGFFRKMEEINPLPQNTNSYLEAREWLRGLQALSLDAVGCQQTVGSPRQFPHTSAAEIRFKKGGTELEMLSYHPQDPQNWEY